MNEIDTTNVIILVGGGLAVISIFTSLISYRIGAPLLLVFLGVGLAAGIDGIGHIEFDDAPVAYFIGSSALALILFDSGFGTRLQSFRVATWPSVTLATAGVLMTTGIVGYAAYLITDVPLAVALLFGAVISSTDAAAVFFLLRVGGITLRDRVRSTLEIESGSNDPMAVLLTLTLVQIAVATGGETTLFEWSLALELVVQIGLGLGFGYGGGILLVATVNKLPLDPGLRPVFVISAALALFGVTAVMGGSGYLAVYLAGLVAGNRKLVGGAGLERFQTGLTWLGQIAMFVTLGLFATPSQFPGVLLPALALAAVLALVARPLAVYLCLMPFRFSNNEKAFVSWVGLRGAVSILLAIVPIMYHLEHGRQIFNMVFIIVVISLAVQGWTIRPVARWLGLIVPPKRGEVDRIAIDLPGDVDHELLTYQVHGESPVAKGARMPRWARPSLVIRDGEGMSAYKAGDLKGGDRVYVFAAPAQAPLLDEFLGAPPPEDSAESDPGFFGTFPLAVDTTLGEICELYGLPLIGGDSRQTVAMLFEEQFGHSLDIGDRLPLGPIELVASNVDANGELTQAGIDLEPQRTSRHQAPFLPSPIEIFRSTVSLVQRQRFNAWKRRERRRQRKRQKLLEAAQRAADKLAAEAAAAAEAAKATAAASAEAITGETVTAEPQSADTETTGKTKPQRRKKKSRGPDDPESTPVPPAGGS